MKKKTKTWNKNYTGLKMACWNPWGLCNERFNFCMTMDYDVLGLTELHNVQNKKGWKGRRWITCDDSEIDALTGKTNDPASGVGLLLSRHVADRLLAHGSIGTRIVWGRFEGPVCPLLVVLAYVPHKYKKTSPCATDVLAQLHNLLSDSKKVNPNDCVILMGDFNCELQRNVQGCTDRWFMNKRPDDGHSSQVIDLLRSHDLFTIDSLFKPKKKISWARGEAESM